MKLPIQGAIDCDVHPGMPGMPALLPYVDPFWRDQFSNRHIDQMPFALTSYLPTSPISARSDWRAPSGAPAADLDAIRRNVLDRLALRYAILNPLHGAVALFNEDMAAALCSAVNDWVAAELLDREPRLRSSIVVYGQNPELAVEEIERVAPDKRFVQVLLLAMGEGPLGRRGNWPIYAAAEKHGLVVGIHAGSTYRVAPTYSGWPSYRVEDYVAQSAAFETQLLSLVAEGVFQKFPQLKVVLIESGFTWLPSWLWRTAKTWRGVRPEVPWIDQSPADIVRERVRLTLQPVDAPGGESGMLARTLEHMGSDRLLLFSSDYPHWQFEGDEILPAGLPEDTIRKMLIDNPLETYPRLGEAVAARAGAVTLKEAP
jgi:predicted TIM-barrel fold metal-dependent hydrolase